MENAVVWGIPGSSKGPFPILQWQQRRTRQTLTYHPSHSSLVSRLLHPESQEMVPGQVVVSMLFLPFLPLQLQAWKSRGDRTVLVIAHRLQTVQNADQILVLKQGELLDHAQLREGQDLYSRLVQQHLGD